MAPGNPLHEFDSELSSTETRRRVVPFDAPLRPASDAHQPIEPVEASAVVTNEVQPPLASASGSPTTAPLLSLEEVLRRDVAINWDEAVAVVEEVCTLLSPAETGVPGASDLFIADGAVVPRDGARAEPEVSSAGRLLHSLLSNAGGTPVPLRLFVTQASAQGTYANIEGFAKALAYFGKPGRRELIRALYVRCATVTPVPAPARPAEPKPEVVPSAAAPPPARKRPALKHLAVAMVAAMALSAAGVWVWLTKSSLAGDATLSSLVAQAREAISGLGIGGPAEEPPASSAAAAAPQPRRDGETGSRVNGPRADAPRLVSRTIGSPGPAPTRSRRPARPPMPVLIQPPSSAELSARNADETARDAAMLTIYSSKDAGVEPPMLLHPQIPANLMLAGESRLNIMELLISETGSVEQVRLIAGPSRLPDVMLLSGAKAWRFQPASRDGEAVRYRARVSWAGTP
jgi:hypothetical protein